MLDVAHGTTWHDVARCFRPPERLHGVSIDLPSVFGIGKGFEHQPDRQPRQQRQSGWVVVVRRKASLVHVS